MSKTRTIAALDYIFNAGITWHTHLRTFLLSLLLPSFPTTAGSGPPGVMGMVLQSVGI